MSLLHRAFSASIARCIFKDACKGQSKLPLLKTLKIHVFRLFIESGSEQPPISESFALQKVCGIRLLAGRLPQYRLLLRIFNL
jgi:hypothetical protein